MKGLKKLALVSAIAMTSAGAFAMEAADDSVLSDTTGQSGITIDIAPGAMLTHTGAVNQLGAYGVTNATQDAIDLSGPSAAGANGIVHGLTIGSIVVHDADGFTTTSFGTAADAGAIVIGGGATGATAAQIAADRTVVFADDLNPIVINVDAASNGGAPVLNVAITTPTLAIKTGAIYVATSNGVGGTVANKTKVLNGMEMVLGATTINVQLGHELQTVTTAAGAMTALVKIDATLNGGLVINNTQIDDSSTGTVDIHGGSIYVGSMGIHNAGSGSAGNLNAIVGVNVSDDLTSLPGAGSLTFTNDPDAAKGGLVVYLQQVGTSSGIDISMSDVTLGKAAFTGAGAFDHTAGAKSLGDVEILGLNLNGTSLIIHGH